MSARRPQGRRVVRLASAALVATIAITSLVACSNGDSSQNGPVTIKYWGWVIGMEKVVAKWNKSHPDIQVKFNRIPGGDTQKIQAAHDAGQGPDLAQIGTELLIDYSINKRVQDVTQYLSKDESNYTAASWKNAQVNGKIYGLPQGASPTALMYRDDILKKYGIAVPQTWDEYIAAARKLHAADPSVYFANLAPRDWGPAIYQAGVSIYGTKGNSWTVDVDGALSQKVATRWQTLVDDGLVSTLDPFTPDYWAAMNNGKIASAIDGAWFPAFIKENAGDTKGNWRVAPMPSDTGKPAAGDTGGSLVVVMSDSKHPKEASEFLSWLNGSDATASDLITICGLFPATVNGLKSPALKKPDPFFGGQVINDVFAEAVKAEPTTYTQGPNGGKEADLISEEFGKAFSGDQTFKEALTRVQAETIADLKSRGLSVAD
jgi:multiple sugar transport system substrate-binding protein